MSEDRSEMVVLTQDSGPEVEGKPFVSPEQKSLPSTSEPSSIVAQPLDDERLPVSAKIFEAKYWAVLKLLYDSKLPADLLVDPENKWYLTHFLVTHGKNSKLALLLDKFKANPNLADNYGQTPLHLTAIHKKGKEMVTIAKDERTVIDSPDVLGCTPLLNCVKSSFMEGFAYLYFEKNAKADCTDVTGSTLAHWAAIRNNVNFLRLLRKLPGTDFSIKDKEAMTPVHRAVKSLSYEATKYLIQFDSNWTLEQFNKCEERHPHIAKLVNEKATAIECEKKGIFEYVTDKPSFKKISNVIRYAQIKNGVGIFYICFVLLMAAMDITLYINHTKSIAINGCFILSQFLLMLCVSKLLATTDPGYLPKKTLNDQNNAITSILERFKNNNPERLDYCFECLTLKARSVHHCDACKKCVLGFHCHLKSYFGGVCVGDNNFSYYFFCYFLAAMTFALFLCNILSAALPVPTTECPLSMIERFIAVWKLGILAFGTTAIILIGLTQVCYNLFMMLVAGSYAMTLHELRHAEKHPYLFKTKQFNTKTKRYVWVYHGCGDRCVNLKEFFKMLVLGLCSYTRPMPVEDISLEEVKSNR